MGEERAKYQVVRVAAVFVEETAEPNPVSAGEGMAEGLVLPVVLVVVQVAEMRQRARQNFDYLMNLNCLNCPFGQTVKTFLVYIN